MNGPNEQGKSITPDPRQWAEALLKTRQRLMTSRPCAFPSGTRRTCPVCHKRTLVGREDLLRETAVGAVVIVHHNLHGARCTQCKAEFLEAFEELVLEDETLFERYADYQAKVTSVSGRNLGTYWPKDIVRLMGLHNQDDLRVQILDPDTMLVRRERVRAES